MGKCINVVMLKGNEIVKKYPSMKEAAKDLGCVVSTISKIYCKKNRTYNGYRFTNSELLFI